MLKSIPKYTFDEHLEELRDHDKALRRGTASTKIDKSA